LLLGADEAGQGGRHGGLVDPAGIGGGGDRAGGVQGGGLGPEGDRGPVALGLGGQERQQPGGPAQGQDQDPGGRRVEGAAVADPALAAQPAHPSDHVVGGHLCRLVADEHPVHRAASLLPDQRPGGGAVQLGDQGGHRLVGVQVGGVAGGVLVAAAAEPGGQLADVGGAL